MDLTTVRILVGKQLGISEADARTPANLSQELNIKLGDHVFKYVADHPDQFEPRQVEIARKWVAAWGTDTPLLNTSFDWGLLAHEIAANVESAAEDVAGVGKGVLTTLGMAKWLIPLAALTVVGLIVYKYAKGQPIGIAK